MRDKICLICQNNQNTQVLYKENFDFKKINYKTFSARRIPDGTHYRFLKCNKCGLIFSSPILNQADISKLYSESTFDYSNESEYLKRTYFSYFQKYVGNKYLENKKILEIGCGNGFFLEELEAHGAKMLYGVEPGKPSVDKAKPSIKKNIKVAMFSKELFPNQKFDLICCFHTLDHIIDPDKFLSDVSSLLKKNGRVFFVVHDTNGLSVKLLGGKSPIFDIEHIYLFNQDTLKRIFGIYGFNKAKVFVVKNKYPISYWLKLIPIPRLLKNLISKVLKISRLGNVPVSLSAGNIGIVADK